MSFKKIERWPAEELRRAWPTVQRMVADDWDVLAVCKTYQLTTRVDLKVIRALKRPHPPSFSVSLLDRSRRSSLCAVRPGRRTGPPPAVERCVKSQSKKAGRGARI
jgi:hypothetical protein